MRFSTGAITSLFISAIFASRTQEALATIVAAQYDDADTGILSNSTAISSLTSGSNRLLQVATCTSSYVECSSGFVVGNPSQSCAEACGGGGAGGCCYGLNACNGFMGKVCKDGVSCIGEAACQSAAIPFVVDSCNSKNACKFANIPKVVNGCKGGLAACYMAGGDGGTVGNIINSCTGGYLSCGNVGQKVAGVGTVGSIQDSCKGARSCYYVGRQGVAGNLQSSCTAPHSCRYFGWKGTVGNLLNSCTSDFSCYYAAKEGSIGTIISSCTANNACKNAGRNDSTLPVGTISSDLNNCCTANNECEGKNEATLPGTCEVRR
jgi:hypothetical protein